MGDNFGADAPYNYSVIALSGMIVAKQNNYDVPPIQIINMIIPPNSCGASGCNNLYLIMDGIGAVGVVNSVIGFAEAINEAGESRILMPGSLLYAGEKVRATENSQVCVKDVYSKEMECHSRK